MEIKQEFLILDSDGDVVVYAPSDFPPGTPIGPDARRLAVVGPSRVRPPKAHLTNLEFDRWCAEIERAGHAVTLGPFWTSPRAIIEAESAILRGSYRSLEDVRHELLRQADGRSGQETQRLAAVESPNR